MTEATPEINFNDVCFPKELVKENPDKLTDTQLGWLIKTRHKNGLAQSGAILLISRKIYIHKPKFFAWFVQQQAT